MKKMKSYKGFTATVEFDADEMLLHGRIDNIKDVVTFHAGSVEQLQSHFQEAVDDYLDLCSERGEEPDKPYSGRFVVRLDPDQHRRAALSADRKGVSLNTWIVEAVDAALSSGGSPDSAHPVPDRPASSPFSGQYRQSPEQSVTYAVPGDQAVGTSRLREDPARYGMPVDPAPPPRKRKPAAPRSKRRATEPEP